MALLDHTDYTTQANKTLTADGQALANKIATAILAWAERRVGYGFATGPRSDSFSDGGSLFWLSAPANVSSVTVSTYNSVTDGYDAYPYGVRSTADGIVKLDVGVTAGFQLVRVSYTAGWSEADFRNTDLHQALTELLVQKFDAAESGGQQLKRVSSASYTEEYALQPRDVPADIQEVVDGYRPPRSF